MSRLGPHRRGPAKAHFKPLQFGGWQDYQDWVDHDFMPRPGFRGVVADENSEPDPVDDLSTIEILPVEIASASVDERYPDAESNDAADQREGSSDVECMTEFVVRPYVRTGGRAVAAYDIRLETMLVTTMSWSERSPAQRPPQFSDVGRICSLCEVPLSLAELSAYLRAPLGVVRVLVGDAISQGLISAEGDGGDGDGDACPTMQTLRRVHEGLLQLA